MTLLIIFLGFLFGATLQIARLNRYNVISGMATLENLAVAKAIAVAIGVGAILINLEIGFGFASYHVKPFILGGIMIGGLIFGVGMAILGYCPGTLAISLGEGSLDALWGIIGGLIGGLVYTLLLPGINPILGPNLGSISLNSLVGGSSFVFYLLVFVIGGVFIVSSFILNKIEKKKDWNWLYAGVGLAVLNMIVFLTVTTNRIIGASTTYPYLANLLTGNTSNDYFIKIQTPGNWELLFLGGAFVSGIIISLFRKEFKFTLIHDNWKKYKGNSSPKRIAWALVGGFILIFGARMAGGCTSGHVISGGMQLAVSSIVFAVFVFAGLLITGKVFYKMKK
ncbi:YeeE/YedE thiosulfate transporter family protein [Sunxiuqinia sp. A32]|uniref:YeeE/YedE thiosulfate transporter family protein n=1 Tax=Sunxiuqinia sp. A32 TaxID=3461496 RepID=UPI00404527E7